VPKRRPSKCYCKLNSSSSSSEAARHRRSRLPITAWRQDGSNFYDDKGKVLSVPEKDVISVARADVEDRMKASGGSATVRLAR